MIPAIGCNAFTGKKNIQNQWIAVGWGTNNVVLSTTVQDLWLTTGSSILNSYGLGCAINGEYALVMGSGSYKMMKSADMSVSSWTQVGSGIFTTRCYHAAWNGSMWVAVGSGTNAIAYSYDGINWIGCGLSVFTQAERVAWNGSMWIAGATAGNYRIASSPDGINWTGRATNSLITYGKHMAWNGSVWKVVGATSIATSSDGINWTAAYHGFGGDMNTILWNGSLWIIGGTAGIATSPDGTTWTLRNFIIKVSHLAWDGTIYRAVGPSLYSVSMIYSYDAITWYPDAYLFSDTTIGGTCIACVPETYLIPNIT